MKKSVLLSAILLSSLIYTAADAQISIHVGLNIPARRIYIPAPQPVETVYNDDFDDSDDYYYLPEVEAYYSIPTHRYFYNNGGRWVSAAYLPSAYRNYDLRTARRFEVRGRRPYMNHDVYRNKWGGNNNRGDWNRGNNNYAGRSNNYGFNRGGNANRSRGNWENNRSSENNGYKRQSGGNGNNWVDRPQQGRNDERGRNNWGDRPQQNQSNGNDQQGQGNRSGGQQPNQNGGGRDRDNIQAQPSNNNGGSRDRGNNGGGKFAQNQNTGKSGFARPRFN